MQSLFGDLIRSDGTPTRSRNKLDYMFSIGLSRRGRQVCGSYRGWRSRAVCQSMQWQTSTVIAAEAGIVRLRAYSNREVKVLSRSALQPVTDCNCVAMRRGGEQQEVNDQSVG